MTLPRDVYARGEPRLVVGPAVPRDAHDADTLRVSLDMAALIPGAAAWQEVVRLAHVNAAELSSPEGAAALAAVQAWLADRPTGTLRVWGREKYGRLLADYVAGGESLSRFVAGLPGTRPIDVARQLAP